MQALPKKKANPTWIETTILSFNIGLFLMVAHIPVQTRILKYR